MSHNRFLPFVALAACLAGNDAGAADLYSVEITPGKYLACKTDANCTAVEHRCGGWSIVNSDGKKEIYRVASHIDAGVVCTPNRTHKPTVICQNNACAAPGYYLKPLKSAW